MVVFSGQGDARRSMALLWRTAGSKEARTAPGPKPGLDVDTIVAAGIAVADEQGMADLSMRAVGVWLGRSAMALYTYVPSKNELIDLMHDRVLAELPTAYETGGGWRPAVVSWADDVWAFYLRHPWVLQVSQARPVLGPGEYTQLETVVRILDGIGLEPLKVRRVISVLFQFVRGMARVAAELQQAGPATGVSDEEWWSVRSALLMEAAPDFAQRFPAVAALESGAAPVAVEEGSGDTAPYLDHEAKEAFRVGLDLILDGIDAAVLSTSAGSNRPTSSAP
ncbi:TetR/AcrR family transcriptional regulator [Streptomyces sp. So13.3]|uniref:TetR/AcrR family transcriptional regulator n=1 Tax=Streptomyces TaxID=1883 RepID=UPI001106B9EC|nr:MULTISPECIES: TetR/AcrR family transcriptional regulator C-terminal domain-containing protein [Streptomyces]MCZ4099663.1 TetR/AcrR family transcriptional regulator C-terminal domain-containing protein [Streptomyces sp. H39-C1]QNA70921.1 TetR/AcrR family transcriptional regulator [Streptomyces sp. So13.3]